MMLSLSFKQCNDYSVDLDERSIGSVIGENENKLSNEDAEKFNFLDRFIILCLKVNKL